MDRLTAYFLLWMAAEQRAFTIDALRAATERNDPFEVEHWLTRFGERDRILRDLTAIAFPRPPVTL